ncbi:MAG TPA: carbonate dehydratase [Bacteroidia bacterium]|nr:carbonate dehydratase [Bacteroidia bacterium]
MDELYKKLLDGNREWVAKMLKEDPDYFNNLANGQSPPLLWIGCSDSRVPANQITNTKPGEVFVHRNIANMVIHTDMNMLSVLDFAVQILKVKHVIVCGHYGCGGIIAAMSNKEYGLIDNWLRSIKDIYRLHQKELDGIADEHERKNRLVELNVIEQVSNLCKTSTIQNAWSARQSLQIHGWVYDVANGIIKDLKVSVRNNDEMSEIYRFDK